MKVVSTDALTKLIQLVKSAFIKVEDVVETDTIDSSTIAGWGMPSTKETDLVLGASGATYTAPANGWFVLIQRINDVGLGVVLQTSGRTGQQIRNNCSQANQICAVTLPVLKGEVVAAYYGTLSSTTSNNAFKFIYAEGDK